MKIRSCPKPPRILITLASPPSVTEKHFPCKRIDDGRPGLVVVPTDVVSTIFREGVTDDEVTPKSPNFFSKLPF